MLNYSTSLPSFPFMNRLQRINRDFVLAHLPELFATIETHEYIRERLIFDVIELPCVDHANMSTNFLVRLCSGIYMLVT